MNSIARFSPLQRTLHWLMAVAIIGMLFVGAGMVSSIEPKYLKLLQTHEVTGILILVLAIVRLAVRLYKGSPPLPAELPPYIKLAASLSHCALYALMISMPLIGWAMLSTAGQPLRIGDITVPPIYVNEGLHALLWRAHVTLGLAFFAIVLLHIAAALFHALIRKDGVFEAMASHPPA